MDNDTLIGLLQQGSQEAYTHLVREHDRTLYSYAISLCGDGPSAQDIVQNVFFKTWEKRKKLKPNQSIKGFLLKSTYNQFINHYHRSRAASKVEMAYREALDQVVEEHDAELLQKKIALLAQAIAKLPPKCKETFILSKKEGLTNMEIAEHLNISLRTVEWHLTQAYGHLRTEAGNKLKSIFFLLFGIGGRYFQKRDVKMIKSYCENIKSS